jgi:cobalt/nickel transport system ATP-binding protein
MKNRVIEITKLNYSYPDGTRALHDISFEVNEGESLGIIGPNGAGKSTLLLHLNGILMNKGSIRVFGTEVKEENLRTIRSRVGLIFQDPDNQLFMPTVFEDVAFGPLNMGLGKDEVKANVKKALDLVDMTGAIHRLSHHLSFGEKKRVSIATVLAMDAEILVLDEPTSNLDPRHRRKLIEFLDRLEVTKIIATHDLDMVLEACQRVILIDQGQIVAEGKTRDILSNEDLLELHGLEVPLRLQLR